MTAPVPERPKIYHILHVDRLPSVIEDGCLFCDARMNGLSGHGSTIGMSEIKRRRLTLPLSSHDGLHVGDCVPFYFCPRSVMLYILHRNNTAELSYHGGQEPIVHLEADLRDAVDWAEREHLRWAFTLSNAGSHYFEDRCDLAQLPEIDWAAVANRDFRDPAVKEGKQAEFLLEARFPWASVERIGVRSATTARRVADILGQTSHRPRVEIHAEWYY